MDTRRITSMEQLPEAAAALKLGGLVAVPTETVYGLCANGAPVLKPILTSGSEAVFFMS